jgi:hypothetical protein
VGEVRQVLDPVLRVVARRDEQVERLPSTSADV